MTEPRMPGGKHVLAGMAGAWVKPAVAAFACLLGLFTFAVMSRTGLRGDEYTYTADAQALARALTGRAGDQGTGPGPTAIEALMGTGWFMPGMKLWGVPLYTLVPDPPLALVRGWAGLLNLLLLAGVVRMASAPVRDGAPAERPACGLAMALLVFPGLAVLWHVAAFSFLPDLPGGLLAMLGMLGAWRAARDLLAGEGVAWRRIAAVQLAFAAAILMRGPLLLMVLAVDAALLALALATPRPGRWRSFGRLLLGSCIVPVLLLPWSLAASRYFDAPVLTTTNFPLVIANSFGDPQRTCFGPCTLPGPDIVPSWQFAQNLGARTGENPLAVQRRMMAASLEGLDARGYFAKVRVHMGRFLMQPQGWYAGLHKRQYTIPRWLRPWLITAFTAQTLLLYVPFMLALLTANLVVVRSGPGRGFRVCGGRALQLQSLAIKLATACILTQPFLHKSSARYWGELAPFAAWSAVLLLALLRQRRAGLVDGLAADENGLPWLTGLQAIYAAAFLAVAALILVA